jgi:monoamine oxidase
MHSQDRDLQLTRRQFLRRLGIAGSGVLSLSLLHNLEAFAKPKTPSKIIILGAGLSGLCAAYELQKLGHDVTILEADKKHIGGRARTLHFGDGLYGEAGAMRIPFSHELTRHYINEFNLPLRRFVQSNPLAYYFARGRRLQIRDAAKLNALYDLTDLEATKSPDDFWAASMGKVLSSLSDAEKQELSSPEFTSSQLRHLDSLSLRQLFEQAGLSQGAIELLATTYSLQTSLDTAATEEMRVEYQQIWSQQFDEIIGGTDRLAAAFASRLKRSVARGCEVVGIEQNALAKRTAAVYREDGKLKRIEGDWLICTIPLPVLARLNIDPLFSGGKMRAIRELNYDSSTKVLAVCDKRFWETDEGIYGGGSTTDLITGTTYYPSDNAEARDPKISQGPGVMLASYTWGQPARRLASLPPSQRHALTLQNVSRIHPQLSDRGIVRHISSWSWDNFQWSSGAFAWFMPGQHTSLYRHLISPEGRVLIAGEHASLSHTWMQGALESVLNAVQHISKANA